MAESGLRDKIPPNNLEAEKATLGAILMNSDSLLTVSKILRPDDFYKNANKKIYQAMLNLDQQNSSNVDILTVIQELKRIGTNDFRVATGKKLYGTHTYAKTRNLEIIDVKFQQISNVQVLCSKVLRKLGR